MSPKGLWLSVCLVGLSLGCSSSVSTPTSATPTTAITASADRSTSVSASGASVAFTESTLSAVFALPRSGAAAISFPPRNEPVQFRAALEAKYRDGLRRPSVQTFVDQEGTVVWAQEYLRYRVNFCSHADAVSKVMSQIDGQGISATCGNASTATFPPRNEPFAFMLALEAKYRDSLRRPSGPSFVDVEGNIVWTQEYLRYRVSTCSHAVAQQKVFDQIDGRGVQSDCTPVVVVTPTPSPTPGPGTLSCGAPATVTCINGGHQGVPTARCGDGVWSCSTTGPGTCSGHGGIACRVCPGPLC